MAITVRIPTPLRKLTSQKDKVSVTAENIAGVIDALEADYPGVKGRLCDESGALRHFVNIYLNGEDTRYIEGFKSAVKDGDEVSIVPAVAGG